MPERWLEVADPVITPDTSAARAVGNASRYNATTPAARGADPEVPLNTAVAVLDVKYADRRLTPGAKRSRQVPLLEKYAIASDSSVAPTVIAAGSEAGE
jgi:hypothetical protein